MTSGVKLRKIDQLIEKFFYNGLRPTNAVQVEVKMTSQLEDGSENELDSRIEGDKFLKIIQDDQKPSTSKVENHPDFSVSFFFQVEKFIVDFFFRNPKILMIQNQII